MYLNKCKLSMKILGYLLLSVLVFFAPIQGVVLSVGVAIGLDTFFGIWKSVKISGWKSFSSRKLSVVISKSLLYQICILTLFVIDKFILHDIAILYFQVEFIFTKILALVLIFIEGVSIKENFEVATGKDVWGILKKVLARAKEIKEDIDEIKPS